MDLKESNGGESAVLKWRMNSGTFDMIEVKGM